MQSRLPSLNALRVFEAAARLRSFKMAAEELHVTQSAVSRQIKLLERQLQIQLFWRTNQRIECTPAAETLLPYLSRAFSEIGDITNKLSRARMDSSTAPSLAIAATPGISECWLGSRLGDFIRTFPNVNPEVAVVGNPLSELKAGHVDMAIEWDKGDWPDFHQIVLMDVTEFPVCSPDLLRKAPPLQIASDLRRHRLLHLATRRAWEVWLRMFDVEDIGWTLGPVLTNITLYMSLAVAGEGVALGDEILAGDDLICGRLVKPLCENRTLERRLHLLIQPRAMQRPEVKAFRDWLMGQIESHLAATQDLRQDAPFYAVSPTKVHKHSE